MKESNLISVIIPTLNQGSQITVLLDKLIGQSLSPAEIIVVDSQSDDGTPALVSQYSPRVGFSDDFENPFFMPKTASFQRFAFFLPFCVQSLCPI